MRPALGEGPGEALDQVMADDEPLPEGAAPGKALTPAARGALEEAAARRRAAEAQAPAPKELNGPAGPEPTRYGDWERKGIAVDF
jgi:hypothetical protein